ncbi:rhodanese-like domain-containing protein [Ottowia thiooxydans]|uniref:rhodanese-like domain-containing protein n=1 Tax=Ottowia thiooxydans TaxID=219182 RepID=UPI0003FB37DE|nr:rhodanese-like domain-containing protein [Ottowia thiooxydans]
MSHTPFATLGAAALRDRLSTRDEIAVIDVREAGLFAEKHLLLAVSAPFWRLRQRIDELVPRRSTPIVLVDLDGSLLQAAAEKLQRLGYTQVSLLEGGTLGWEAAGYELFSGDNVPSKALGEVIEVETKTPHIDVAALNAKLKSGEKLVIVDGRTPEEFYNFSLPGAHSVPNAELPYRIRELAPEPDTLVVVNCAGRTRSIIGAQTLLDAGIPNPVVSLQDGTMAWLMAGHELKHGRRTALPEPSAHHLEAARVQARALSQRSGVQTIDDAQLASFAEDDSRNLYRLDIRTIDEYRSGHLPGWRWAPGGQLVQATDAYVGTRHARVVLADWDGVRAHSTAAWLVQLGAYEVYLYQPSAQATLETGDPSYRLLQDPQYPAAPSVSVHEVIGLQQTTKAQVFDVDHNHAYGKRHIAGARFVAPSRVFEVVSGLAAGTPVLLTSRDGVLAQILAAALSAQGADARAILGGNKAWFEAELPTEKGREGILSENDDWPFTGYLSTDLAERDHDFRTYLQWELDLVAQLEKTGGEAPFKVLSKAA